MGKAHKHTRAYISKHQWTNTHPTSETERKCFLGSSEKSFNQNGTKKVFNFMLERIGKKHWGRNQVMCSLLVEWEVLLSYLCRTLNSTASRFGSRNRFAEEPYQRASSFVNESEDRKKLWMAVQDRLVSHIFEWNFFVSKQLRSTWTLMINNEKFVASRQFTFKTETERSEWSFPKAWSSFEVFILSRL